jgi:O-antigen/teichoic acid export membrane protein
MGVVEKQKFGRPLYLLVAVGALQGSSYLLTFFWNLTVARRTSVELYGQVTFAFTIITLFGLIIKLGQQQALVRFFSSNSSQKNHKALQFFFVACGRSFLVFLAIGATGVGLIKFGLVPSLPIDINLMFKPVLVSAFGLAVASIGAGLFQSQRIPWAAILFYPFGISFFLAIGLVLSVSSDSNVAEILGVTVWAHLAPGILAIVVAIILFSRWLDSPPKNGDQSILSFGFKAMQIGLVYLGITHMDRLMLGLLASTQELGIYGVATRFAGLMYLIVYLFPPLVGPIYAQEGATNAKRRVYQASTYLVTVVVMPMMLIMLFGGGLLISGLVGSEYEGSVPILQVLAISIFFVAATGNNGLLLQMGGRENIELAMSFVTFVLNFGLNLWLIPKMGGWGAAVATAASLFVSTSLKTVLCYRQWGVLPALFLNVRHVLGAIAFIAGYQLTRIVFDSTAYYALGTGTLAYFFTLSFREVRVAVKALAPEGKAEENER